MGIITYNDKSFLMDGKEYTIVSGAMHYFRIPREYWQDALEDYPDQSDAVANFLRNRLGEQWTDKDLKKAIDALIRRGHSYSAVRKALENLSVDTEELPED